MEISILLTFQTGPLSWTRGVHIHYTPPVYGAHEIKKAYTNRENINVDRFHVATKILNPRGNKEKHLRATNKKNARQLIRTITMRICDLESLPGQSTLHFAGPTSPFYYGGALFTALFYRSPPLQRSVSVLLSVSAINGPDFKKLLRRVF